MIVVWWVHTRSLLMGAAGVRAFPGCPGVVLEPGCPDGCREARPGVWGPFGLPSTFGPFLGPFLFVVNNLYLGYDTYIPNFRTIRSFFTNL